MGNQVGIPPKKLITIQNFEEQLSKCKQICQRKCPIYGNLHTILYKNIQIDIGKSPTNEVPNEFSLHHIIQPQILLVPPHRLLQNFKLSKYERKKQLINLIIGICDLAATIDIGLSHNRVAFSQFTKRWCILGQIQNGLWNYQLLIKNSPRKGLYLSPQLMHAFSKDKLYPKIDIKQSDVFTFAIILLEIISQAELQPQIYNFSSYQIKLGPILQSLLNIQQILGKDVYDILVKMLELQPQTRIRFQQLRKLATEILLKIEQQCYLSPINAKINDHTPPANIKPKVDSYSPSPQLIKQNTESYSRGRSPGAIKKNLPLNDRQNGKKSFSPIRPSLNDVSVQADESKGQILCNQKKKRVSNGYKITPNKVRVWQGMQKQRPKVQPFGLKFQFQQKQVSQNNQGQKSFTKLKTMRF